MAAATRAILNGEISTGPWPYAANGKAGAGSRIAGGDAQFGGGIGERFRTDVVHAQLSEIRIAGNRDGAAPCRGAVRAVADIVFDGDGSSRQS
jgi:hypothetical protein